MEIIFIKCLMMEAQRCTFIVSPIGRVSGCAVIERLEYLLGQVAVSQSKENQAYSSNSNSQRRQRPRSIDALLWVARAY